LILEEEETPEEWDTSELMLIIKKVVEAI